MPNDPKYGWLVQGYDVTKLTKTSNAHKVWWICSCGKHVTLMQPDSVRESERKGKDPFYCIRCIGDMPSHRIAPATSAGEARVRDLLDVGSELYAAHVYPWIGCYCYVLLLLMLICQQRKSLFAMMAGPTSTPWPKIGWQRILRVARTIG